MSARRQLALLAVAATAWPLLSGGLAVASGGYTRPSVQVEVDLTSRGHSPGSGNAGSSSISADGRYVVFSTTSALLPGDTNDAADIYLRDVTTGRTELVSRGIRGTQAVGLSNGALSADPSISADGRYVAFDSAATNLVVGDANAVRDVFVFDRKRHAMRLASVNSRGAPAVAIAGSSLPSIDGDGNLVSFTSDAQNLVPNHTSIGPDVYVHNLRTGATVQVDVSSAGRPADYCLIDLPPLPVGTKNFCPSILVLNTVHSSLSENGCCVAFDSQAPNLVAGDTNGTSDVFEHILRTKKTVRVSVASDGAQAVDGVYAGLPLTGDPFGGSNLTGYGGGSPLGSNGWLPHAISANGRYVVFVSHASNLIPNDQNDQRPEDSTSGDDVFVHDLASGRTQRVSVFPDGEEVDLPSPLLPIGPTAGMYPSISADARSVEFYSDSIGGFYPTYPKCSYRCDSSVFISDRATGQLDTFIGAKPAAGRPCGWFGPGGATQLADISADGRYESITELWQTPGSRGCGPGSSFGGSDVFRWDRGPDLGAGGLAGDGRLTVAGAPAFASTGIVSAANRVVVNPAVAAQGGDLIGSSLAYRARSGDLLVREELRTMPSVSGTPVVGDPGMLYGLDLTASGVRYEVRAQRIPGPDYDAAGGASFGLFERDPVTGLYTTKVATLRGGFGTTGEEVVFAIPLLDLGLPDGGRLAHLGAFTAVGTYQAGPVRVLDRTPL